MNYQEMIAFILFDRKVSDNKGGLCGIAAIYQALESTMLTTSALRKQNYDSMKDIMGEELGVDNPKGKTDKIILELFYQCVYVYFILNYSYFNIKGFVKVNQQMVEEKGA